MGSTLFSCSLSRSSITHLHQVDHYNHVIGQQTYYQEYYEVARVSNRTHTSGEHRWESNVTFSVAHVSTTVPSLSLVLLHKL